MADIEINKLCKRSDGEYCCDPHLYTCNLSAWPFTRADNTYRYWFFKDMPSGDAKPQSVVGAGGWTALTGSIISCIAKDATNDTTYILESSNSTCEVALANPVLPGDTTVYFRYRKSASGGNDRGITVSLYKGATLVSESVVTGISENWTAGSFSATPSGSDYSDLRIRITSTGSTGGGPSVRRDVHVSLAKYQTTRVGGFVKIGYNWTVGSGDQDNNANSYYLGTTAEIAAWWQQFSLTEERFLLTIPNDSRAYDPFSWGGAMYAGLGWNSVFALHCQLNHEEVICFRCLGATVSPTAHLPNGNLMQHDVRFAIHPVFENNSQVWVRGVMTYCPTGGTSYYEAGPPEHSHVLPAVGSTAHTYGVPASPSMNPQNSYYLGQWMGTAITYPSLTTGWGDLEHSCYKYNPDTTAADSISVDWTKKWQFFHTQGTLGGSYGEPYVANPNGRYCGLLQIHYMAAGGTIEVWFENKHKTRLNCLDRIRNV